jgi:cytochrome c553
LLAARLDAKCSKKPVFPENYSLERNKLNGSREAATDTLCSRKSYAIELVKALDAGDVASSDLTASHVRQLLAFADDSIKHTIENKWGVINDSSAAKEAAIAVWKTKLTPDVLAKNNLENGAALFKKSCAVCHKIYGEGGKIGPDLTGGNRGNRG